MVPFQPDSRRRTNPFPFNVDLIHHPFRYAVIDLGVSGVTTRAEAQDEVKTVGHRSGRVTRRLQVDSIGQYRVHLSLLAQRGELGDHFGLKREAYSGPVGESYRVIEPDNQIPRRSERADVGAFFNLNR